jgi:hypothetical protein
MTNLTGILTPSGLATVADLEALGTTWVRKTTAYTASVNDSIIADTSGGVWTLTLPVSPTSGTHIQVLDGANWATNNLTISRNGQTIGGDAEDLVVNIGNIAIDLVFDSTTWIVTAQTGGQGGDVVSLTGSQTLTNKTLTSPTFDGTPTAPTAPVGTDTTQVATTAFVTTATTGATARTNLGLEYVSQATAEAGTQATGAMTPLRTKQAITELAPSTPVSEFTFVAAQAISAAGKPLIINSEGLVKESFIASATTGSVATFNASKTSACSITFDPVANVFAVFYQDDGDGGKGKVLLATVASDDSVTFGTPSVFSSLDINGEAGSFLSSCYDPVTEQILIAFNSNYIGVLKTMKITGATISFGADYDTGVNFFQTGICYDLSVSRALVNYRSTSESQKCAVATVSGTSISMGTPLTLLSSGSNGYTSSALHCKGRDFNAVTYNSSNIGKVRRITIDPVTYAMTAGSPYQVVGQYIQGDQPLAWVEDLERLLVVHTGLAAYGNDLDVSLLSASTTGTTWTANSTTTVNNNGPHNLPYQHFPALSYSPETGFACVVYPQVASSDQGTLNFSSTLDANTIAFGSTVQWYSGASDMTLVCANESTGQVVLATWDNANVSPAVDEIGRIAVATTPVPDNRANFIGFSQSSAVSGGEVTVKLPFGLDNNQTGLTPNQLYYLSSSDGFTLSATVNGPAVARALSSTSILVLGTNTFP